MTKDYTVSVLAKNRDTHNFEKKSISLSDFCFNNGYSLKCVLRDIEAVFTKIYGTEKNSWSEATRKEFNRIRGKLLDGANNFERLPETLEYMGKNINTLSGSEYISYMLGQ